MLMRIVLVLTLLASQSPVVAQERYRLSMLPRYAPEEILKQITPLANYLSKALGVPVEPVVTADFKQYEQRLLNNEIQIAYENPLVYARVSAAHEALAVANDRNGSRFRGIIITRADSPINDIRDLKGKTVGIVGLTSAGGYLSQRLSLLEQGLDTGKDMKLVEAVENKQENVILSVHMKDVDAGFIQEGALHIIDSYVPPNQIRVLKRTEWLPNWALSASRSLPEPTRQTIRKALLQLKKDDPVVESLKIDGFVNATDADFDMVRKALGVPAAAR